MSIGFSEVTHPSQSENIKKIAIVCIHGFNNSFASGLHSYGQLFGLADFPEEYTPFYFSWPAGPLGQYSESAAMATSRKSEK